MSATRPKPLGALKSLAAFRAHVQSLGLDVPSEDASEGRAAAILARPFRLRDGFAIGNRFCIQPMEGWDGTRDGFPTELTRRRWERFGAGGAKLIWGGEAVAVRTDGRANPNQLVLDERTAGEIGRLRQALVEAHHRRFGRTDDLLVGLQLTHSGRFSRPHADTPPTPVLVQRHPALDRRLAQGSDAAWLDDDGLAVLAQDFVRAAVRARAAGFAFVDIKHCHGYLGHELLGAHTRAGDFGGTLENRMRFFTTIVEGIRKESPDLRIAVRLSATDLPPFARSADGQGEPETFALPYRHGFGVNPDAPLEMDLREPIAFLRAASDLGVDLFNVTLGSPYYTPHLQRPALYPPSDGYHPPRDPLHEVARHLEVTAALKAAVPDAFVVGSGWSYLQDWLPHVAQAVVASGRADAVGLGRMALSYPDLPADVLDGRALDRHKICRTFSDCTTGPRNGMISGCYPLDDFYKARPDADRIKRLRPARADAG